MKDISIFLDVDNTILCSTGWEFHPNVRQACRGRFSHTRLAQMSLGELQAAVCGPADKVVMSPKGLLYISTLRPFAMEFCHALKGMVREVHAFTAASASFQRRVLAAHGLDEVLDGIHGAEAFGTTIGSGPSILIDDCDPFHERALSKMDSMGVRVGERLTSMTRSMSKMAEVKRVMDRHYMLISPFEGDASDAVLMGLIPAIADRISILAP